MPELRIVKLDPAAILPQRAHGGDLGYDLYALKETVLPHREITLVHTGIACQFPFEYGALIRDRSSVATKLGLIVVAGVIDNGYTGEIQIALYNTRKVTQIVHGGQKIAQMIPVRVADFHVKEVPEIVSNDGRSTKGFGSTDKCFCTWTTDHVGNQWRSSSRCPKCQAEEDIYNLTKSL